MSHLYLYEYESRSVSCRTIALNRQWRSGWTGWRKPTTFMFMVARYASPRLGFFIDRRRAAKQSRANKKSQNGFETPHLRNARQAHRADNCSGVASKSHDGVRCSDSDQIRGSLSPTWKSEGPLPATRKDPKSCARALKRVPPSMNHPHHPPPRRGMIFISLSTREMPDMRWLLSWAPQCP
jgi:hypothetical protein